MEKIRLDFAYGSCHFNSNVVLLFLISYILKIAHLATPPCRLSIQMLPRSIFPELFGVCIYLYYNSKKLAGWQRRNSNKVIT